MVRFVSGSPSWRLRSRPILFLPIVALRVARVRRRCAGRTRVRWPIGGRRRRFAAVVLAVALCWVLVRVDDAGRRSVVWLWRWLWVAADVLIADHSIAPATSGVFGGRLRRDAARHARRRAGAAGLAGDAAAARRRRRQRFVAVLHPAAVRPPTAGAGDQPEEDDRRRDRWLVFGTAFMVVAGAMMFPASLALGAGSSGHRWSLVLGICGDLFESRLKRGAGVKDSSAAHSRARRRARSHRRAAVRDPGRSICIVRSIS